MPQPSTPTGANLQNNNGTLNGTTEVELVAAPGASATRSVKIITIANVDTAAVTVILSVKDGSNRRRLSKRTIAVDKDFIYEGPVNLDTTSQSIVAKMTAAPATTNPDWTSNWLEAT
jgi:hypothetical protein